MSSRREVGYLRAGNLDGARSASSVSALTASRSRSEAMSISSTANATPTASSTCVIAKALRRGGSGRVVPISQVEDTVGAD